MIKNTINYIKLLFIILIVLFPNLNNASEVLIYADNISYDEEENIIARGNAKIFKDDQFIISDLIIFKRKDKKIVLPTSFVLKDSECVQLILSSSLEKTKFFNKPS